MDAQKARQHLNRLFDYADGKLVRLVGSGAARAGEVAGTDNGFGYCRINFDGKLRLRSHLIWLMLNGRWPVGTLDHINGVRSDDRIENLREVSLEENLHNKQAANRNNRLGVRGVVRRGNRYAAYLTRNRRQISLGTFSTADLAAEEYKKAAQQLHTGYIPRGDNV